MIESAVSSTLKVIHIDEINVTVFMKAEIAFRLNSLESMKIPMKMRASSGNIWRPA